MPTSLPPRMVVLGSGSAGNATLVTDGSTTVLIDCGFSARELTRRLHAAGVASDSVSAVLVTHEHGDHVRGIDVFCRRHAPSAVVYASAGTRRALRLDAHCTEVVSVRPGEPLRVGTFEVLAFATSHDAAEPLGYRIDADGASFGIATDTGLIDAEALETLSGCSVLGLECNHDIEMLEGGPYPIHLKRRIRSTRGHLSNTAAADALEQLASDALNHVLALHRSRTNNTHSLAETALRQRLARLGLDTQVSVAAQDGLCEPTPVQAALFD